MVPAPDTFSRRDGSSVPAFGELTNYVQIQDQQALNDLGAITGSPLLMLLIGSATLSDKTYNDTDCTIG